MGLFNRNKKDTFDKKIGKYIWIDNTNKKMMISVKMYKSPTLLIAFDNVKSYIVKRNQDEIIKKSGVGRAIVGGTLFGTEGAVVGAATGNSTIKKETRDLILYIQLFKSIDGKKEVGIPFMLGKQRSHMTGTIEECISFLDEIIVDETDVSNYSSADELRKFKELLDDGIITQEEFELKKEQLLGTQNSL